MAKPKIKTTTQMLSLKYEFTEDEILQKGKELAEEEFNYAQADIEKKNALATHNAILNDISKNITKLTTAIRDGFEIREVECDVRMNEPREGQKTITRKDNRFTWVEEMSGDDFDLFM